MDDHERLDELPLRPKLSGPLASRPGGQARSTGSVDLESVRDLRGLARRVARGEPVAPRDLDGVLRAMGRSVDALPAGRALRSLALGDSLEGEPARRRVFHAARALAEQISSGDAARSQRAAALVSAP